MLTKKLPKGDIGSFSYIRNCNLLALILLYVTPTQHLHNSFKQRKYAVFSYAKNDLNAVFITYIDHIDHHDGDIMLFLHCQTIPYFQRLLQWFRVDSLTLTGFGLELSFKCLLLLMEFTHPVLNVAEQHIVRIGKPAH